MCAPIEAVWQSIVKIADLDCLGSLCSQPFFPAWACWLPPGCLKIQSDMLPKAYRWVREMEEIAQTHADEGGFNGEPGIYGEVAKVYKSVAEDTVLGEEKTERRKRGVTVEDVIEEVFR